MTYYSLPSVPNQTFEIQVNGLLLEMALRTFRGSLFLDVTIDNEPVVSGFRAVADVNFLPRFVTDAIGGTMFFVKTDGPYPTYENFNSVRPSIAFRPYGE